MTVVFFVALNAGLIRAYFVQEMFYGGILIFFALQGGLFCLLRSGGRARRFWLGFEVSGIAAVLAMFSCEFFPDSAMNQLVSAYTDFALNRLYLVPPSVDDFLMDHLELFLAVVYFLPELVIALLGGLFVALISPKIQAGGSSAEPRGSHCPQVADVLSSNG